MPAELLSSLPQLAKLVEQLGVIGLLLGAVGWLVWERKRLMALCAKTFRQRDRARMIAERYRATLAANKIAVDVGDIDAIFQEDGEA